MGKTAPLSPVSPTNPDFAALFRSPGLLFAGLLALAPTARAGVDGFELRGVLIEDDTPHFSIRERESGSSAWLAAGQRLPGLVVIEAHDEFGCVVEIGGVRHILALPQVRLGNTWPHASDIGHPPTASRATSGSAENTSRARQARMIGRISGEEREPASPGAAVGVRGPAHPTANASPSAANAPVAPAARTYTPLLGRKVNRVNSRVHASDHIEQFGAPPAP